MIAKSSKIPTVSLTRRHLTADYVQIISRMKHVKIIQYGLIREERRADSTGAENIV